MFFTFEPVTLSSLLDPSLVSQRFLPARRLDVAYPTQYGRAMTQRRRCGDCLTGENEKPDSRAYSMKACPPLRGAAWPCARTCISRMRTSKAYRDDPERKTVTEWDPASEPQFPEVLCPYGDRLRFRAGWWVDEKASSFMRARKKSTSDPTVRYLGQSPLKILTVPRKDPISQFLYYGGQHFPW